MRTLTGQLKNDHPTENTGATSGTNQSPWWVALLFAGGFLAIGMLTALLSIIFLWGGTIVRTDLIYPPVYPPDWAFWMVWIIIYPTWGVATWLVWRRRREVNLRSFYLLAGISLLANLAFMPIAGFTNSNPIVLSSMDALGLIFVPLTVWIYRRYSKTALWWLTPLIVWMPITLFFKIWFVLLNLGNL